MYTRLDWVLSLLGALGNYTPSNQLVDWFLGWTCLETASSIAPDGAKYNLLNTERSGFLGESNYNSAGVKNYVSYSDGIAANVAALTNGLYSGIVSAVQTNDATGLNGAQVLGELSTWCGGCAYNPNTRLGSGSSDTFNGEKDAVNIETLAFSEFGPGHTEFACGPMSVAAVSYGAMPGASPYNPTTDAQIWAYGEYGKWIGPDNPGDDMGSTVQNMEQFITDTHVFNVLSKPPYPLHYWEMAVVDVSRIKAALENGYPVIVTVTEASVFDRELGTNPYWWGASGNHIFTIVGIDPNGDFLVYDTANVFQGDGDLQTRKIPQNWPRHYDSARLVFTGYGTPIQMPWLPQIQSSDPLNWSKQVSGLPNGAKDDGKTISFANGLTIVHPFREVYLGLAALGRIPPDDEPMNDAYTAAPVEQSNPSWWQGDGMAQETRYFRMGWSVARGALVTFIGQEFEWLKNELGTVQTELASCKALPVPALPPAVEADILQLEKDFVPVEMDVGKIGSDLPPGIVSPVPGVFFAADNPTPAP